MYYPLKHHLKLKKRNNVYVLLLTCCTLGSNPASKICQRRCKFFCYFLILLHFNRSWASGDTEDGDPGLHASVDWGDAGGSAEPADQSAHTHRVSSLHMNSSSFSLWSCANDFSSFPREIANNIKCRCSSEGHLCLTSVVVQKSVMWQLPPGLLSCECFYSYVRV